jgi:hypothetical protein
MGLGRVVQDTHDPIGRNHDLSDNTETGSVNIGWQETISAL